MITNPMYRPRRTRPAKWTRAPSPTENELEETQLSNINTSVLEGNVAPPPSVNLSPSVQNVSLMPFYPSMNTNARSHFKSQLDQIVKMNRDIQTLERSIRSIQGPLAAGTKALNAIKLNVGNGSFRGKNGPEVYLAPTKNGQDVEVRVNFTVEGKPFRASHPNSFNAALRNMKTRRQNALSKVSSLRQTLSIVDRKKREYDTKKMELAKLIKRLQKDHEDYLSKRVKQARQTRRVSPVRTEPVLTNAVASAQMALGAPPQQKGFFGRLFGRGGATRRNRRR